MHQHLESLSHQQKKCDFNILVNSLPYAIKNLLLFKVYDRQIKNFRFFKGCQNSDFISKVLTSFIPAFSKKNAFIIREDEIVENIVFVKEGSLSLKAAINLNHPEESVRKILYEKFVDIPDNAFNHRNSIDINSPIKSDFQSTIESKNTESIISSNKQESIIEQEIGKVEMANEDDIEEGHYQFLKIINIAKNDNYGMIYMFLNKPSPLSLRVRSKRAEIFLLRKQDSYKIAKAYPNIWKKQFRKSYYNIITIKQFTFKTLRKYCTLHNLIIKKKQIKETEKIALSRIQEIVKNVQRQSILEEKKKEEKSVIKRKKSSLTTFIKSKKSYKPGTSLYSIKESHKIIKNILLNNTSSLKFNRNNENQLQKLTKLGKTKTNNNPSKEKLVKTKSVSANKKRRKFACENDESFVKNKERKKEEMKIETTENEHRILDEKVDEENNKNEGKLSKINSTLGNFRKMFVEEIITEIKKVKTKKLTKKTDKKFYKLLSMKLIESLNKLLETFNQISINKINSINNINNSPIISTINTYLNLPDSVNVQNKISKSSLITIENSFSSYKLSISQTASFNFKSSYENINRISNGRYILSKSLQNKIKKFISTFNNNLIKINNIKNNSSDDYSNNEAKKKSSSVKTLKSDLSKNINFEELIQKNIIKEISTNKRMLKNKSYVRLNKYIQKGKVIKKNKTTYRPQKTNKQDNNKLKENLPDSNPNIMIQKTNSEIEYEFSNESIKGGIKISEILDKTRESKKKIHSERSSVLAELNNYQKKNNLEINEKNVDDVVKQNLEANNNQIKEIDLKKNVNNNSFLNQRRCSIY